MITDQQVEAACISFYGDDYWNTVVEAWFQEQERKRMRSALTAASLTEDRADRTIDSLRIELNLVLDELRLIFDAAEAAPWRYRDGERAKRIWLAPSLLDRLRKVLGRC